MEQIPKIEKEKEILDISTEFASMDDRDLRLFLRQKIKENPTILFSATINWVNKQTARKAKAFLDNSNFHFESIKIRATREQRDEDTNAFESGVEWIEV